MERSLWEDTLRTGVDCRENAVERNRIQSGLCTREEKDHSSFQQERSGIKICLVAVLILPFFLPFPHPFLSIPLTQSPSRVRRVTRQG